MKTRKIPTRICVGCQQAKTKKELIRIVLTPEGNVEVDKTGKKAGRGAYLCPNTDCLDKACKEHRLERSLKTKVSNEIYEALKQELS
jgi:predicted RNA-binding protein YlxR (DUF448 family)